MAFAARTPPPQVAAPIVQRLAVQRRARRTNGSLMLPRFPCGGIVRCNGLLGSALTGTSDSCRHCQDSIG